MPRALSPLRTLLALLVLPTLVGAAPLQSGEPPAVYGFVRPRLIRTDGPADAGTDGADRLGFPGEARLGFYGELPRAFGYRFSFDLLEEDVELADAYAFGRLGDALIVRAGRFKAPFLWSADIERGDTLFSERSPQGALWDDRDVGVELSGTSSQIAWRLAAFDASDGDAEEHLLVARGVYQLSGSEISREGIQPGGAQSNASVAVSYLEETGVGDADALAGEFYGTEGPWFLHAEYVEYGDGFTAGAVPAGIAAPASGRGGTSPWAATLSHAVGEDVEIAGRYAIFDDVADTEVWALGLFQYVASGRGRWGVSYRDQTSSDAALEGEVFELVLTLWL